MPPAGEQPEPHESVGATRLAEERRVLLALCWKTWSVRKCQSAYPREVTPRSPQIKLRWQIRSKLADVAWKWKFRRTGLRDAPGAGRLPFWIWLSRSGICLILHGTRSLGPMVPGTARSWTAHHGRNSFSHLYAIVPPFPVPATAFPSSQPRKALVTPQGPARTPVAAVFPDSLPALHPQGRIKSFSPLLSFGGFV